MFFWQNITYIGENGAKFSYYNYVKPLDEAVVDIVAKQLVFVIGTEAIKEMRNQDNKLPLEVTIHDLKEEAHVTFWKEIVPVSFLYFYHMMYKWLCSQVSKYYYIHLCCNRV